MRANTSFGNHSASSHSATCGRSSVGDEAADRLAQLLVLVGERGQRAPRGRGGRPLAVRLMPRSAYALASTLRTTKPLSGSASSASSEVRPSSTRVATSSRIAPTSPSAIS